MHWHDQMSISVPQSHSHVAGQQPAHGKHESPPVDGLPIATIRPLIRELCTGIFLLEKADQRLTACLQLHISAEVKIKYLVHPSL